MHKGRTYRRILPPLLFPNFALDGAAGKGLICPAATWFLRLLFFYQHQPLDVPAGTKLLLDDVDLKTGTVRWVSTFSAGLFDFGAKLFFRQLDKTPLHGVELQMVDNFGSVLRGTFRIMAPRVQALNGAFTFPPTFDTMETSDFFQGAQFLSLIAVKYHEES